MFEVKRGVNNTYVSTYLENTLFSALFLDCEILPFVPEEKG